jgi:hypothetical protein
VNADNPRPPLPSPEAVRCLLFLDTALQLRWAIEELGADGMFKEVELAAELCRDRDRSLLGRLRELLPMEDLAGASDDQRIDIDAICRQHPFVYAVWVMMGASSLVEIKRALETLLRMEQAS